MTSFSALLERLRSGRPLFLVAASLGLLLIFLGLLSLSNIYSVTRGLATVYNDRMVPLDQLRTIAASYDSVMIAALQTSRDDQLPPIDALARVEAASLRAQEQWREYLTTNLLPEERGLIDELIPLFQEGDKKLNRLRDLFAGGTSSEMLAFVSLELRPWVDRLNDGLNRLANMQQRVAKVEYDKANRTYRVHRWQAFICIGLGMLLVGALALAGSRMAGRLDRSYRELADAQEALLKRERQAAIGDLAAVMAHEIRNPLGVLFNCFGTLRRNIRAGIDGRPLLDVIEEEAERLNRIVNDLLEFARPHETQLSPQSLETVIEGALEAMSSVTGRGMVEVEFQSGPNLGLVPLDAQLLKQAFINLLINAMQAMPNGGRVKVLARQELRKNRSYVRVDMTDEGPGIPPGLGEKIFEPFFTTKAKGTGLGLALVKRIVDAHQGEVRVESNPGGGATFTLLFPTKSPPNTGGRGGRGGSTSGWKVKLSS